MAEWDKMIQRQLMEEEEKYIKRRQEEEAERDRNDRANRISELLHSPCGICGSEEHKAITQLTAGDQSTIDYECPAAAQEQWDADLHPSTYRRNIAICTYKFAQMYGFVAGSVRDAFPNLQAHGVGKHLNMVKFYKLRMEILDICAEQKESERRFKRDIPRDEHSNEDAC